MCEICIEWIIFIKLLSFHNLCKIISDNLSSQLLDSFVKQLVKIERYTTVEGHFLLHFSCMDSFLQGFCSSESAKKGVSRISERKVTKISDICLFCLYFQVFYVFNKINPSYLEFYTKSVSYNWNPWVTHFLH